MIGGAVIDVEPPLTAAAGNGRTGARVVSHMMSLVWQIAPVVALITLAAEDGWLYPLFR